MDTLLMNSENSKTSDPHILLLNLLNKINSCKKRQLVASSNQSIYMEKYKKVIQKQ